MAASVCGAALHNWQYEFMRPSIEEIVAAYTKIYGKDPLEEDLDDDLYD